jgi:hypothetical protein
MYSLLTILSALATSLTCASASGEDCSTRTANNTIAFFSGAAMRFSYGSEDPTSCSNQCQNNSKCQAWLYTAVGGECDLFKTVALSTSFNEGFIYGQCGGSVLNSTITNTTVTSSQVSERIVESTEPDQLVKKTAHGEIFGHS